jgi:hypothetical protein
MNVGTEMKGLDSFFANDFDLAASGNQMNLTQAQLTSSGNTGDTVIDSVASTAVGYANWDNFNSSR